MTANSNRKSGGRITAAKPGKPARKHYVPPKPKGSPLTPHASGKWMKKIKGKLYYFGRWGTVVDGKMVRLPGDGYKEALADYEDQVDGIYRGKPEQPKENELTIRTLCNVFRDSKKLLLDSGDITARTFAEYEATTTRLYKFFGRDKLVDEIVPADFERLRASIQKNWGPVRLGNEVVRVRSVFKHSRKGDVVPDTFKKPSAKKLRFPTAQDRCR